MLAAGGMKGGAYPEAGMPPKIIGAPKSRALGFPSLPKMHSTAESAMTPKVTLPVSALANKNAATDGANKAIPSDAAHGAGFVTPKRQEPPKLAVYITARPEGSQGAGPNNGF